MMKPLHEDQIHSPAFQKLSDYIWAENNRDYEESVKSIHAPHLKLINSENINEINSGVVYVGMGHLIEKILPQLLSNKKYIVIHHSNDRSFTEEMASLIPDNVIQVYTMNNKVNHPKVTTIPIGLATINGEDNIIKKIAEESIERAKTKVFSCYNTNPRTTHRNESIPILEQKPFVDLYKCKWPDHQLASDEFFRRIKAHKFTMSLKGLGADCLRTWQAITLGSIPIVTDCLENRQFEDMPIVFCPSNMDSITEEWLDEQNVEDKSTERLHMSYWAEHINKMRSVL